MKVILISVDSLRADFFDLCKSFGIRLETLTELRNYSLFFPNTFAQTPLTLPSHASMFTGLYPFNHGLRDQYGLRLKDGTISLFDVLNEKKIPAIVFLSLEILNEKLGYRQIHNIGRPSVKKICKQISKLKDGDFFIFIHYWGVHTPYDPPKTGLKSVFFSFLNHIQIKGYLNDWLYDNLLYRSTIKGFRFMQSSLWHGMVDDVRSKIKSGEVKEVIQSYVRSIFLFDKFLSEICNYLKRESIYDDVNIIITGDHGECFNEHSETSIEPKEYMHGHFLYNNTLKVPILLKLSSGRKLVIKEPVKTLDIFPTILDLYQINTHVGKLDGISLLSSNNRRKSRNPVYFETLMKDTRKVGLIYGDLKIIRDLRNGKDYVFNLRDDPQEMDNIAGGKGKESVIITEKLEDFLQNNNVSFEKTLGSNKMIEEDKELQDRLKALGYI